jgi:hypothetical protein
LQVLDRKSSAYQANSATGGRTGLSWWRLLFRIEQIIIFVGLAIYALLASLNLHPSLWVIMIATLSVGNLVLPLAFAGRRVYAYRPFPWNWLLFFPVQIVLGFVYAFVSVIFLQVAKIVRGPFWDIFRQIGYL